MAGLRSSTVIIAATSPGELFAIVRCLVMVHRERVDVVARGRRLDAGSLLQRGGDALVAVAAFRVHSPPPGWSVDSSVNRNWFRVRRTARRHRMRARQRHVCVTMPYRPPGLVISMRSVNTLICTCVPRASGRIITVGERVRNRLAQHEPADSRGFFAPIPTHQRVDRIVDHHRNRTDHRLEATNRSSPRNTSSARPRKPAKSNAEPRIELLRISGPSIVRPRWGASFRRPPTPSESSPAQHLQIQQHIDAVSVGEHARMLFARCNSPAASCGSRSSVVAWARYPDRMGCRCSSMSRSTSQEVMRRSPSPVRMNEPPCGQAR